MDSQDSYGVWKSMEFDLSIFQVWKSMEKRKQSMEKYVFPDFCLYLVFFIIKNSEFNENKFIVQEVRFHGSC